VEQPAIQLMQHELGWEVEKGEILNFEFWILNGTGMQLKRQEYLKRESLCIKDYQFHPGAFGEGLWSAWLPRAGALAGMDFMKIVSFTET